MFDEDQELAFRLSNGHNLIISGQAGTGKTFLVKRIVKKYSKEKHVAIVCSTGIAATHYGDLGAVTLHKWAGIEDGRHVTEELIHLVLTDERFVKVKNNIEITDLLVIDEISMISAKTFNQLEMLCRNIRNNDRYFGGMQVILAGDFYQLPPVANEIIGDPGNHCYKLPWFNNCFPHKVKLNIIHRQSDTTLIKCINELEIGDPSDESVAFLKSLDRPLPSEEECIHLFARNYDVDIFNYNKLQNLPGELKLYKSRDEGSNHYLSKFLAPKNLGLKVGCPVMLVRNLSDSLVNGLCGTVVQLMSDSVDVKFVFEKRNTVVTVKPVVFTTFDPVDKITIAKRTQLPLKLAYAITVHKAQGMTLKNVVINCENCYQPGQIGVAVGRAQQVEGLRVINFKKTLCRKHPLHVTRLYENFTIGNVQNDLSCCRGIRSEKTEDSNTDDDGDNDFDFSENRNIDANFESDSDFSDSEIEKLEILDSLIEQQIITEEFSSNAKTALDSVFSEFVGTPLENEMFSFKQRILENFQIYHDWYQLQSSVIEDIGLICLPEGEKTYSAKQQNDFFVRFNKYLSSDEYKDSVISMLNIYSIKDSGPQFQFLTTLLFYLERKFFEDLSGHLDLQDPESIKSTSVSAEELLAPARGKIRYISGYVLAKLKHNLSVKTRNSLFAEGDNSKGKTDTHQSSVSWEKHIQLCDR
ncbi:uncharacterized protein LOC133176769 [Saccostrea echinata]|uniref:uncharacterized protein LOC133176769 n=1 Tax=Saccostrea echinata TaxID=191078 RepID=UPI002A822510|nr:uncharacterized protein LOC133176769 [Saccostrea echinata]